MLGIHQIYYENTILSYVNLNYIIYEICITSSYDMRTLLKNPQANPKQP